MKRSFLVLGILFAVSMMPLSAGAGEYKIDPYHSSVGFKVGHLDAKVPGWFTDVSGDFVFDEENPGKSWVKAEIKTASIDTRVPDRNNHLKNKDFFFVEKYPLIGFSSKQVKKIDDRNYKVVGDLTMRGVTKEVVLDVVYNGMAEDHKGNKRAAFSATTTIDRMDYGVAWNTQNKVGRDLIGEKVEINLEISAVAK